MEDKNGDYRRQERRLETSEKIRKDKKENYIKQEKRLEKKKD